MPRVVVTGGAGFIGSHLCEALLAHGDAVVALDCFDEFYDPAIKRKNLEACRSNSRFELVEGDIRDAACVERATRGADAVVHLAARAGVRPSIEQPLLYQDVNVHGTTVMLEAARKHGINRFIFASSSSVYGDNEKVPFSETDNVDHPISPYAATKKAGELLCHTYHHLFGLSITCLRFFTVYGPRQRPDLAIHKFVRLIETGRPIPVFGDGSMMRDFTYIDDIVAGTVAALDRCQGYRIYNLGESRPVALRDLIAAIERALGKKAIIDRQPLQPGDVQRTYADVSRAERELGYQPSTEIDAGLARFVQWFRTQVQPRLEEEREAGGEKRAVPPKPAFAPEPMSDQTSIEPVDVSDEDLFCLECGYNLRGLEGDPRRCPECSALSSLEDLRVPAALIRDQGRKLETLPSVCVAWALALVWFGLPLAMFTPRVGWPIVAVASVGWLLTARAFVRSCDRPTGAILALGETHLTAFLLLAFLPMLGMSFARSASAGTLYLISMLLLSAMSLTGGVLLYRDLRRRLTVLRRRSAVALAKREYEERTIVAWMRTRR